VLRTIRLRIVKRDTVSIVSLVGRSQLLTEGRVRSTQDERGSFGTIPEQQVLDMLSRWSNENEVTGDDGHTND
jgi:hypothetical protein